MGVRDGLGSVLAEMAAHRGARGFTFADLLGPGRERSASLSELTDWLAQARSSGFVVDVGFDAALGGAVLGARRYRIASARDAGLRRAG